MELGEFNAKAVSWDFGVGEKADYVAVECEFLDGPNKGMSSTWRGMFMDDVSGDPPRTRTEWTKLDLQKMGWDGKDLLALNGMGSRVFRVKVDNDREGKPQIRRIFAAGGLAIKNRMSDEQKKALAARVMGSSTNGKKEVRRDSEGYELDDDGKRIPF